MSNSITHIVNIHVSYEMHRDTTCVYESMHNECALRICIVLNIMITHWSICNYHETYTIITILSSTISLSLSLYIYIYTHIHIYIYILNIIR